jgi:methylglutaconyl-CoA hydratase
VVLHTLEVEYTTQAALVWMSRADVRNVLDPQMIAELAQVFHDLGRDPQVRVIVLGGRGIAFCAGADPAWARRDASATEAESRADSDAFAGMLQALYACPKPTIARVHGVCMAGGMALAACCDIAISSSLATYALPDTRMGLVPTVITPYVVRAMGARHATRWLLTGETFSAMEAWRVGFVHDLCDPEALDLRIGALTDTFMLAAPNALATTKELIHGLPTTFGSA